MPKKKKVKKNYLLLTVLAILAVLFVVNIFIWWDLDDLLNTISTTFTSMWWSFATPVALLALIFSILMLVDTIRKSRLLWFLIVLIAPLVGAVAYYLLKDPKIIRENAKLLGWLAIGVVIVNAIPFTGFNLANRLNPPKSLLPVVEFSGTLLSTDAMAYHSDGPGVYSIQTETDVVRVDVGPHRPCDVRAARVPNISVGQKVLVRAEKTADKNYAVCSENTYLKKQ